VILGGCVGLGHQKGMHAMPLARYGVLAGRVVDRRAEGGTDTPHYQIQVRGGDVDVRVAVNVLSKQHPSELLYLAEEAFTPTRWCRACPV
jgi:uncharacterized protein YukJ